MQQYKVETFETPANIEKIYASVSRKPHLMILDSSLLKSPLSQYSIIVFEPFLTFKSKKNHIEMVDKYGEVQFSGNPLNILRDLIKKYSLNAPKNILPFLGGCVGFLSYDLCHCIEKLPDIAKDNENIPDIFFGFYDSSIIIDHAKNSAYIVVTTLNMPKVQDAKHYLQQKILHIKNVLEKIQHEDENKYCELSCTYENLQSLNGCTCNRHNLISSHSKDEYCKMVQRAREYILNGDIFQVNLSQKFRTNIAKNPFDIFKKLRTVNSAPFSAYINLGDLKIISCSPERFLKISNGIIETRPIKGTKPRGSTFSEDEQFKKELLESTKDAAEHTMIIDVERNDLGRICKTGTVEVTKLFEIETYATVHHLVSTVKGVLKDTVDIIDCIKATFPGGSITGAPKIRAMEITEELETEKRGIYTGAIGYISSCGNVDLNIAIRTIVINGNEASFNVGGGIVWDSIPEKEYEETLFKGKAMMDVLTENRTNQ